MHKKYANIDIKVNRSCLTSIDFLLFLQNIMQNIVVYFQVASKFQDVRNEITPHQLNIFQLYILRLPETKSAIISTITHFKISWKTKNTALLWYSPMNAGRKQNVHKTFRRRLFWTSYVHFVYVLCPRGVSSLLSNTNEKIPQWVPINNHNIHISKYLFKFSLEVAITAKKWISPLRISSVNPQFLANMVTFTEEFLNGKHFSFFMQCSMP